MGLFSKNKPETLLSTKRIEDVVPIYNTHMRRIQKIGESLYKGYLPDTEIVGDAFSYLKGFHDYKVANKYGEKKRRRKTLQVPQTVSAYLSNLIYRGDINVDVITSNKSEAKRLKEYLDQVLDDNDYWNNTSQHTELMWNNGGKIEKATVKNGKIIVEFINARNFYEWEYNNKEVFSGVFVNKFKKNGYFYTKLTKHERKGNDYHITKELYKNRNDSSIGTKVPYNSVFDDVERYVLKDFKSIPFSYTKPNIKNNQDFSTPLGIPIFWNSLDIIAEIDLIFDKMFSEYKFGGRQKVIPSYALKNKIVDGEYQTYYDPDDETIFSINSIPDENKDSVKDLTSPIRDQSFIAGINHGLDMLCWKLQLSVGTFRFDGKSIQTATQVIHEKSTTFGTKKHHEKVLKKGHRNLFMSILELAYINGFIPNLPSDLEIKLEFDDSIVVDDEKVLENMKEDAESGAIPYWRYVAKRYKISEEEAKQWVSEAKSDDEISAMFGIKNRDVEIKDES